MNKNIIQDAKKYVNKILTPLEGHYYHSYEHAIDVMQRAIYLAEQEGLSVEEIEMLALAWIFHDTGFVVRYDKNEPIGAHIASNYLKSIHYDPKKIEIIKRVILATDPDYKDPKDIYEKIIKDSDMDNLGRDDFQEKANNIKKEIETIKKIKIKDPDWNHSLVSLLLEHQYNTDAQKKERLIKKYENTKDMITKIREKFTEDMKQEQNIQKIHNLDF